jgi:hypothetical protein
MGIDGEVYQMRSMENRHLPKDRKRWAMVLALIPAILISLSGCNKESINNEGGLPEKLGDVHLVRVVKGDEAAKIVHKLHGKDLGAKDYLIGHYGARDSRNTLYLSVYGDQDAAKADLMTMAMKMQKGSKVFKPLTTLGKMGTQDSISFRTEGMGLAHYFHRVGNRLLWWQAAPDKAESTYNDLLTFYSTSVEK